MNVRRMLHSSPTEACRMLCLPFNRETQNIKSSYPSFISRLKKLNYCLTVFGLSVPAAVCHIVTDRQLCHMVQRQSPSISAETKRHKNKYWCCCKERNSKMWIVQPFSTEEFLRYHVNATDMKSQWPLTSPKSPQFKLESNRIVLANLKKFTQDVPEISRLHGHTTWKHNACGHDHRWHRGIKTANK